MEYTDDGDSESELLGPVQESSSSAEARDADQSEIDEEVAPLGMNYLIALQATWSWAESNNCTSRYC